MMNPYRARPANHTRRGPGPVLPNKDDASKEVRVQAIGETVFASHLIQEVVQQISGVLGGPGLRPLVVRNLEEEPVAEDLPHRMLMCGKSLRSSNLSSHTVLLPRTKPRSLASELPTDVSLY
jgi:hypothetical protein